MPAAMPGMRGGQRALFSRGAGQRVRPENRARKCTRNRAETEAGPDMKKDGRAALRQYVPHIPDGKRMINSASRTVTVMRVFSRMPSAGNARFGGDTLSCSAAKWNRFSQVRSRGGYSCSPAPLFNGFHCTTHLPKSQRFFTSGKFYLKISPFSLEIIIKL